MLKQDRATGRDARGNPAGVRNRKIQSRCFQPDSRILRCRASGTPAQ